MITFDAVEMVLFLSVWLLVSLAIWGNIRAIRKEQIELQKDLLEVACTFQLAHQHTMQLFQHVLDRVPEPVGSEDAGD